MTTASVRRGRLLLTGLILTGDSLRIFRGFPDRGKWEDRDLNLPLSDKNLNYLTEHLADVALQPDVAEAIKAMQDRRKQTEQLRLERQLAATQDPQDFIFRRQPYQHQRTLFYLSRNLPYFAVFAEMGTGKTKPMLDTAAHLFLEDQIDLLLVIAPNGVHRQWVSTDPEDPGAAMQHLPDWCEWRGAYWGEGAANERAWAGLLLDRGLLRIFSLNCESLQYASGYAAIEAILKTGRVLCVVDESSRFKTPSATRTKNLQKLRRRFSYRRILSGSPLLSVSTEDLYAQYKFLDPSIIDVQTFTEFKALYCEVRDTFDDDGKIKFSKVTGSKNVDQLLERVAPYTFRVTKDECLDLPPKVYNEVKVELSKEQRRHYDRLRDELWTLWAPLMGECPDCKGQGVVYDVELAGEEDEFGAWVPCPRCAAAGHRVDVKGAIVKLLRLQQVVCGHLPGATEASWVPLECPRLDLVETLLEDINRKTIVWCRFKADVEQLYNRLHNRYGAVTYYGPLTDDEAALNLKKFRTRDECRVFIGTQAKGGIGLDMIQAAHAIYYSNSFNAEHRWQSEDRIHRIGQTHDSCTYFDLITPGTVDRHILRSLKQKRDVAFYVLDVGLRAILQGD
jgi:hypothetical protein